MSLNQIQKLAGSLAKSVADNERLATPVLAAKLAKCLAANPGDQTLGAMARVMEGLTSNNTMFIRKADFRQLYNKFYSRTSKFAELFQDELGIQLSDPELVTYKRDDATQLNPYESGDQILANALNSVFDKNLPLKMYSQALADKAKKSVGSTLDSWNLRPTAIDVKDGNDKFLVIKADYETPKGVTSFYVPVEVTDNSVAEAEVFMGNTGPEDLNHKNLKAYLTDNAGAKLKITATNILEALTSAASDKRELSDTELAIIRLNNSRQGKSEFFEGQVVGQKVAEAARQDVQLPKYDEFESFEKQFTSPSGLAAWKFGAEKVKNASAHIVRELVSYGHKNPQVTVAKNDDTTIFYNVSLDAGKVGFVVPVKVANDKLVKPNIMICNGSVSSFNQEGINELYVQNASDFKAAAAASPQFGLKPSDLINNIRTAFVEGNYAKAEDALNVLANTGDTKAYATGFQVYMQGLGGKKVEAAPTCSMIVKNSSSEHPICGHTGLPVHKTYQDKDGNCRPLYRKGMDETYEGAVFNNSKIFG